MVVVCAQTHGRVPDEVMSALENMDHEADGPQPEVRGGGLQLAGPAAAQPRRCSMLHAMRLPSARRAIGRGLRGRRQAQCCSSRGAVAMPLRCVCARAVLCCVCMAGAALPAVLRRAARGRRPEGRALHHHRHCLQHGRAQAGAGLPQAQGAPKAQPHCLAQPPRAAPARPLSDSRRPEAMRGVQGVCQRSVVGLHGLHAAALRRLWAEAAAALPCSMQHLRPFDPTMPSNGCTASGRTHTCMTGVEPHPSWHGRAGAGGV